MLYGIIAGSGIDNSSIKRVWQDVSTPYGSVSVSSILMSRRETLFIRRHGVGLNVPPHLINYRANLWAMKELGVKYIIATAAVGSLHVSLRPGTLSVIKDFIDFTKSHVLTIYDKVGAEVIHTDFSHPYSIIVSDALQEVIHSTNAVVGPQSTYICVDGPRYETPAEINMYKIWGGDIVGMTGAAEAILAKEMMMEYGSLAIITNYAAGVIDQKLSHFDVLASVNEHRQIIYDILEKTIGALPEK